MKGRTAAAAASRTSRGRLKIVIGDSYYRISSKREGPLAAGRCAPVGVGKK